MDLIEPIVAVVLLVAVTVLVIVELRISRKRAADRTARERSLMEADRAVGRAQQWYGRRVAPWLVLGISVVGLVLTVPLWLTHQTGVAIALTILFVVLPVGMLVFWALVLRRRGSEWQAQQDQATREADAAGRPRFFLNGRVGLIVGFVAVGLGVAATIWFVIAKLALTWPVLMLAIGGLMLVMGVVQFRAERRDR